MTVRTNSSEFYDDCGILDTKSGCSPKTLVNGNKCRPFDRIPNKLTQLVYSVYSVYCTEKQTNKERTYLRLTNVVFTHFHISTSINVYNVVSTLQTKTTLNQHL